MPDDEAPTLLMIFTCGYRARCVAPAEAEPERAKKKSCPNLAPNIFRYTDSAGRPMYQRELCNHHSGLALNDAKRNNLKIIDERKKH